MRYMEGREPIDRRSVTMQSLQIEYGELQQRLKDILAQVKEAGYKSSATSKSRPYGSGLLLDLWVKQAQTRDVAENIAVAKCFVLLFEKELEETKQGPMHWD